MRIANIPLHVVQRGHDRSPCFITERNFDLYLGLLGEYAPRMQCEVHAYVLMPNHVHLLLTPRHAQACTRLMREVHQRYSSHRSNAWGEASPFVVAHERYVELGRDPPARQTAYRQFFARDPDVVELEAIRAASRGGLPLGSEQFVDEMERLTGRRLRKKRPGRPSRDDGGEE